MLGLFINGGVSLPAGLSLPLGLCEAGGDARGLLLLVGMSMSGLGLFIMGGVVLSGLCLVAGGELLGLFRTGGDSMSGLGLFIIGGDSTSGLFGGETLTGFPASGGDPAGLLVTGLFFDDEPEPLELLLDGGEVLSGLLAATGGEVLCAGRSAVTVRGRLMSLSDSFLARLS